MTESQGVPPLVVANCSGFYGDRLSAAREMVEGGPIDVLTGDWLAELTMLLLSKDAQRREGGGFARTFLSQMRDVLGTCVERGIKVVSNAGGLNPAGLAAQVQAIADELGLDVTVAWVDGDDVRADLADLRAGGEPLRNLDTGELLLNEGVTPLTANVYLGGSAIAEALHRGADVVITGRVTDAAVIVGPGIWRFGWKAGDLDALAGAVAAGHVIECGCQATGGNFAFFDEIDDLTAPGFPIAELSADGSSVITKHPGTGGAVTVETVTAQLLYEINGPRYPNPDVVTRLDTVRLAQVGPDRVQISGTRGEPAPDQLKIAVNVSGGYRNQMLMGGTGLNARRKAEVATRALWARVPGGQEAFETTDVRFIPSEPDPERPETPWLLRVTVMDRDKRKVGRAFSSAVVENALSVYPGYFSAARPGEASEFGIYLPTLVDRGQIEQRLHIGDETVVVPIDLPAGGAAAVPLEDPALPAPVEAAFSAEVTSTHLGLIAGTRSGDKGGNVNLGVWGRNDTTYAWLRHWLTAERLGVLLPELAAHRIDRYELPNIRGLNFVVHGLLGVGVAASLRWDAQAKTLGEQLRACRAEIPNDVIDSIS